MGVRRDCNCPKVTHLHGTPQAYNRDRCRCDDCKAAGTKQRAMYTRRAYLNRGRLRSDSVGIQRRIQALSACGWSAPQIAEAAGATVGQVMNWRSPNPTVYPSTRATVIAVYEKLWNAPPTGRQVLWVRLNAARSGWAPPLAWDDIDDPHERPQGLPGGDPLPLKERALEVDPIAVDLAVDGHPVKLTRAEKTQAIDRLTCRGLTDREIGQRLRMDRDTVVKHRSRHMRVSA